MRLHLLASLVFAPSLVACASAGAITPVVLETAASSTPTTVFLETAGMELAPPTTCDYVVAIAALDEVYGEAQSALPACSQACRVDTCRSMAVQAEVMGAMYYDEFDGAIPQMLEHCEQTIDSCMGVTGVVMLGEPLDSLGLDLPTYDEDEEEQVVATDSPRGIAPDPAAESACQNGDAAACYALVDLDMVLMGWEMWQQPLRETSLKQWQRACELEPMVYCRGLDLAIEYTTDEGCGG